MVLIATGGIGILAGGSGTQIMECGWRRYTAGSIDGRHMAGAPTARPLLEPSGFDVVASITPVIHCCMCGPAVDDNSYVRGDNGKAIPGRYAA